MSTPAERAAVLRGIHADTARRNRRTADRNHMPDSSTSVFERSAYWEQRTQAAFTVLEDVTVEWRVAAGEAGQWPDEDPGVIALGQQRDAAFAEYERCRDLRDQAMEEFESLKAAIRFR
ncbi:hypothetical protein [Streptomyces sp. NPDC093223]|uniref:hypothetical protein n=1 Tax=Streptomyces sp. NPDC093223 TaxID=3366033 RepID=UPI00382E0FA6